jgi:hypothetical protein
MCTLDLPQNCSDAIVRAWYEISNKIPPSDIEIKFEWEVHPTFSWINYLTISASHLGYVFELTQGSFQRTLYCGVKTPKDNKGERDLIVIVHSEKSRILNELAGDEALKELFLKLEGSLPRYDT